MSVQAPRSPGWAAFWRIGSGALDHLKASVKRLAKIASRRGTASQAPYCNELGARTAVGGGDQNAGSQFNLHHAGQSPECWSQVKVDDGSCAGVFVIWRDRRVGQS
jgi:hypothetical protein